MTEWILRLTEQTHAWLAWQTIEFAQPDVFFLLAIPLTLWFLSWVKVWQINSDWQAQQQSAQRNQFRHTLIEQAFGLKKAQNSPGLVKNKPQFAQLWRQTMLRLLRIVIVLGLVIAAAQPQQTLQINEPQPQVKTVRDLMFVVESSASFLLPDYQINDQPAERMDVVKKVLDQFMAGLAGNRFGLVLYAEQAYTLMPLTDDLTTARLMLQRLRPYLAGRTDEAMGEALGLALRQAQNNTANTQKRVLVLISDGLSQPSRIPLESVIDYAQALNLPIYTIGVGAGSAVADKRIYSGLLYEPLEANSLKTLAQQTGGRYFAVSSGQDLQLVLQTIDKTEGVQIDKPVLRKQVTALFEWPLLIGGFALVLYLQLRVLWRRQLQSSTSMSEETRHVG